MSPDALNSLLSLCIGFALAGALASGYQALVQRPAGFGLLQQGVAPKAFAAVPFLVFAAPFIIMRNTLRGARIERRRFEFVMMATVHIGILEPDVRHVFPDDAARRRTAGLNGTSMPRSSRETETDRAWRSTNSTGRRPNFPPTATTLSPTPRR